MSYLYVDMPRDGDSVNDAYITVRFQRSIVDEHLDIMADPVGGWHIKRGQVLHSDRARSHFSVYRCDVLPNPQEESDPARTVIAKFGMMPGPCGALEQEALTYTRHLKGAQGHVVPRFLGFYTTRDSRGDLVAILLLEDCGRTVTAKEWRDHFYRIAAEACTALARFHQLTGFDYGNFSYKHLIKVDGTNDIKLVSFNKIVEHDCDLFESADLKIDGIELSRIVHERLPDPGLDRIGCEEIHDFCLDHGLVIPVKLSFGGNPVAVTSDIKTFEDACVRASELYPNVPDAGFADLGRHWQMIRDHIDKYALVPWTQAKEAAEDIEGEDAEIKEEEVMDEVGGAVEE